MNKKAFYKQFLGKFSILSFQGILLPERFEHIVYNAIKTTPLIRKITSIIFGHYDSFSHYICSDIKKDSTRLFIVFGKTIKRTVCNDVDIRSRNNQSTTPTVFSQDILPNNKYPKKLMFEIYNKQDGEFPGININIQEYTVATVHLPGIINIHIKDLFQNPERINFDMMLLSRILKEAFAYLSMPEDMFYYLIYSSDMREFRKAIAKSAEDKIAKSIENIDKINANIDAATKTIIENKEKLIIENKKIEAYEKIAQDIMQKIYAETDFINNIAGIESVDLYSQIDSGVISVFTKNIYVNNQRSRYLMGKYKIEINLVAGSIRFLNQNDDLRRRSYWGEKCHHPHCDQSGRPCWGNINTQVSELISSFDLSFLVNLCLSYLSSVNIKDSAGRHIVNWPLVDGNGKVIEATGNSAGLIVCENCNIFMPDEDNEGWHKCSMCEKWHCEDHIRVVSIEGESKYMCNSCLSLYKECSVCGELHIGNSMNKCELCNSYICADCSEEYESHPIVYLGDGTVVKFYCNNHIITKCPKCGINILENSDCPQCSNVISVKQCVICGDEIINELSSCVSDDADTNINLVCPKCREQAAMCSFCGQYDLIHNLYYDSVLNIYKHEICPTGATENSNQGE